MTPSDKLREIAKRIYGLMNPAFISDREKDLNGITNMLTALISEGYVTKEKYMDDLCDEYQRGFEDGMDEARNTDRL